MIDKTCLFYLVWRDSYIRYKIRVKVFENKVFQEKFLVKLIDNHQYIANISETDKLDNGIFICSSIRDTDNFIQYYNNQNKYAINDLKIEKDVIVQQLENSNSSNSRGGLIHDGVQRLTIFFTSSTCVGQGDQLPDSVTDLSLFRFGVGVNEFIDSILTNLPPKLRYLLVPDVVPSRCVLPDTMCNMYLSATPEVFNCFVVPPNKVFKGCKLRVNSPESLQWLHGRTWIITVLLHPFPFDSRIITKNQIPAHIVKLEILYTDPKIQVGALPASLQTLSVMGSLFVSIGTLPRHLKRLYLEDCPSKLEKGILPSSLRKLEIVRLNQSIDRGVLPDGLKTLVLPSLTLELEAGSLPNSLTWLSLDRYDVPLKSSILPSGLKVLIMSEYSGSFDQVVQLNSLEKLHVNKLDSSIARVISNVVKIKLRFYELGRRITLENTLIENLILSCQSYPSRLPLLPRFLPLSLRCLTVKGMRIQSSDVIPNGCVYLKSDIKDLQQDLLPKSVKSNLYKG
ncbi:hypothetical protein CYY_003161 [Polysphondylium violaceum]|uniref:Uncharacterized protein n=1 Tax=Polysphondylium violaceum TaxID=133409 RepID=A0A8J4PXA8_9MYCE|nr:hypothetical protein CYY_003161 [Polysphondylium violaceum]